MRRLTDGEFDAVVKALREDGYPDALDLAKLFRNSAEMPRKARDVATKALREYDELHPRRVT